MALLKRDEFLALPLRFEDVAVPGGVLRVWELDAGRLLDVQAEASKLEDRRRSGLLYAANCVGDEAGPFVPPYTPDELARCSGAALTALVKVAMRLNFATAEVAEEQRGN